MRAFAVLSILAVVMFLSGGMFKLSQASDSALNPNNALHVIIHEHMRIDLIKYFNDNYPKEFATCIYGDIAGNYVEIYDQYSPIQLKDKYFVYWHPCRNWYDSHRNIGFIHSHPDGVCELSEDDKQLGNFLMGVVCGDPEAHDLAFYSSTDNYTNKYFAEVI